MVKLGPGQPLGRILFIYRSDIGRRREDCVDASALITSGDFMVVTPIIHLLAPALETGDLADSRRLSNGTI
jgi:hypothetical protein